MRLIFAYSGLLMAGMAVSQVWDIAAWRDILTTVTMVCLAYIMVEVGLEFTVKKTELKTYGWDYLVAMTAAAFPWVLCALYFMWVLGGDWKESWFIGRFAAPTSAGVLFSMLAAAGLATTWLFKKVRILAIFDDLDTVLLMIPLKIMVVGWKPELLVIITLIALLLYCAYKWLHMVKMPISKRWLLGYSTIIVIVCELMEHTTNIHLEVLLPAFVLGCMLFNPHDPEKPEEHAHEHTHIEPEDEGKSFWLDRTIKLGFMFLVGVSLPKIELGDLNLNQAIFHVLVLTFLSNLGKCFPILCYRKEASLRERAAVAISMFPRGEVGAGVLLVALGYGFGGTLATIAALSLALNLLMTGVFIAIVILLLKIDAKKIKGVK